MADHDQTVGARQGSSKMQRLSRRRTGLAALAMGAVGALLATTTAASASTPHAVQTSSSLAAYSASYGYRGHAGLYGYGMGYDATDNSVLVGDIWNYQVKRFKTDGTFVKVVSKVAPRGATGGIGAPFGVAADKHGNVWVADQSNSRTVEFDHNGTWVQSIGSGGGPNAGENYPVGCGNGATTIPTHLVIDPTNDDVYVSDPRCGNVYVFNSTGTFLRQFTWPSIAKAPIPRGVGMDTAGNVYVAEFNTKLVYVFSKAGTFVKTLSAPTKTTDMSDARGLAVDNVNNRVYVVGAQNNKVVVFSTSGAYVGTWSSYGATPFNSIRFVSTDSAGNVYVSDLYGYVVYKFDSTGNPATGGWATPPAPPPNGGWNQLNGVAIDPASGNVYGVDTFGNRVQQFDTSMPSCTSSTTCPSFIRAFGQRGPLTPNSPNLDYPHEVAIGTQGDLWMDGQNVLLHFKLDGTFISSLGIHGTGLSQFKNGPQGIQVVGTGSSTYDIYTVDAGNCRIQVFDQTGALTNFMGGCGKGTDQMTAPRQLAVDAANHHVYVADTGNSRIVEWDTTTKHIVAMFNSPISGLKLNQPRGVALDPLRNWLYIGDSTNNRVVRIHADLSAASAVIVTTGADTPQGGFTGPEWMNFSGKDGRLFVSDNNQTIYAFTITG